MDCFFCVCVYVCMYVVVCVCMYVCMHGCMPLLSTGIKHLTEIQDSFNKSYSLCVFRNYLVLDEEPGYDRWYSEKDTG